MKLRDVSATEIAEVVKLVRSNPAAAAELTELIASGQVEVTTRSDGTLSVRAAEASDTVATSLTAPFKPGTGAIDSRTAYQEIAKIAASPEGKIALQKHRTGQGLTPSEAAIIKRHDALLAANSEQAFRERPKLPGTYSTKPEFASKLVRELVAERDGFTRINDARQAIAELRARGDHPAFNEQSPNHKQGVEELHQLYQIAYPDEPATDGGETK